MTVGPAEGLTSAIGDELNDFFGVRATRLTAQFQPEVRISTGINTANYTRAFTALAGAWVWDGSLTVTSTDTSQVQVEDYIRLDADGQFFRITAIDPNVSVTIENPDALTIPSGATPSSVIDPAVVTLSAGTYALAVANGDRFRVQSGTINGISALVDTRDSGIQITLQTGLPEDLTDESWEVVNVAETSAAVETTLDWDDSGLLYIDGVKYSYASKTLSTFDGMKHFDGVTFVDGAKQLHQPLAEVLDHTKNFSALDSTRRSVLVDFASGEDLDVIGRNLGVPRPPALTDDDTFRALIKAIAYAPRGTVYALELALDALFGPGNYELFEDMTLGSINNPASIFVRRTDIDNSTEAGKTFIEGPEARPLASATTVAPTSTAIIMPQGVRSMREGYKVIRTGTDGNVKSSGLNFVTTGGSDLSGVLKGDIVRILDGPFAGEEALVAAPFNASIVDVYDLGVTIPGMPLVSGFTADETGLFSFEIIRPVTQCRFYKPSSDVDHEQFAGDTGLNDIWEFTGGDEATDVTVVSADATHGDYLDLFDNAIARTVTYRHRLHIQPESNCDIEIMLNNQDGFIGPITEFPIAIKLHDGEREIIWACGPSGPDVLWSPARAAGAHAGGDFLQVTGTWVTFRIEKRGRNVQIFANGRLVSRPTYSNFDASTATELEWGFFDTVTAAKARIFVKYVDWYVETPTDYWNLHLPDVQITAPDLVTDTALGAHFQVGVDEGKTCRFKDFKLSNAQGGFPVGHDWEVAAVLSPDQVQIQGITRKGAIFEGAFPDRLTIRDLPDAFTFPNLYGYSIEILGSGPNAGVYAIDDGLDPVTFQQFSQNPDGSTFEMFKNIPVYAAGIDDIHVFKTTNVLKLTGATFVDDDEAEWRLVPALAVANQNRAFEMSDAGVDTPPFTLRQSFPIPIVAGFTPVVDAAYSEVLSAQLLDREDRNDEPTPGSFDYYPFYLFDGFGFLRDILTDLTAAGVILDFDRLFRDAAGPHIL